MRSAGATAAAFLLIALVAASASAAEVWRYRLPDGSVGMTDDYGKIPAEAVAVTRDDIPAAAPRAESEAGGRLRRWLDGRAAAGRRAAEAMPPAPASADDERERLLGEADAAAQRAAESREAWRSGPPPAANGSDADRGGSAATGGGPGRMRLGAGGHGAQAAGPPQTRELLVLAATASMTSGLFWRALVALVLAATALAVWKLAALAEGSRRLIWRLAAIAALALWSGLALPPAARAWQVDFAALVDAWQGPAAADP